TEREELRVRVRTEQDHGNASSDFIAAYRAARSAAVHSEQSSHLNPESVWYHRQHAFRSHAHRAPTQMTRPDRASSGRAIVKNASMRSRISSRRSGSGSTNAANDAAHDAPTLPHNNASPTRQARWAVSTR